MEDKIKAFLGEKLLVKFESGVTESTNLFEIGMIDSFGYMELVKFLESEFSLRFTPDELVSDAFVSVANMKRIVQAKSNAS